MQSDNRAAEFWAKQAMRQACPVSMPFLAVHSARPVSAIFPLVVPLVPLSCHFVSRPFNHMCTCALPTTSLRHAAAIIPLLGHASLVCVCLCSVVTCATHLCHVPSSFSFFRAGSGLSLLRGVDCDSCRRAGQPGRVCLPFRAVPFLVTLVVPATYRYFCSHPP